MTLIAEVAEDGTLKIKSPDVKPGDQIHIKTEPKKLETAGKGKWSAIEDVLREADTLDFPRRTHEEILQDLHESRRKY